MQGLVRFSRSTERLERFRWRDSERETPLPIPNRAVKPLSADGTWRATARESRSPPVFLQSRPVGRLSFLPACTHGTYARPMESTVGATLTEGTAMEWVRLLAEKTGPRRPTGRAERRSA